MDALIQQLLNGLVSGGFYALLALGLTVIWGMLKFVNFAHGAMYMFAAFGAIFLRDTFGFGWLVALIILPIVFALVGMVLERLVVRRLLTVDRVYGFLFTFGLALVLQGLIESQYGVLSKTYEVPEFLRGSVSLGSFTYPIYQLFVLGFSLALCGLVAWVMARSRVGIVIRAAIENPTRTSAFGINIGRWITPVFGFGIAVAAVAGVLAAPTRAISSTMGNDLIIILFAVVIIGGLGSIFGSVLAGFGIGIVQGLCALYAPALAQVLVFILMAILLLVKPSGIFGKEMVES